MSPHAEGERPDYAPIGFFGSRRRKKKHREDAEPEDTCPHCHNADRVVPIYYGKPNDEVNRKSRKGELVFGGNKNPDGRPHRHCKGCGMDF